MNNVTIIGIDLAKRIFHAHGVHADGSIAFRKRMTRAEVLPGPLFEGEVGGDDDGCALVKPADEVEQKLTAGLSER